MAAFSYTYKQVAQIVLKVIEHLRLKKVDKSSKCIIVGSAGASTAVAMLACASLGISHLVLFDTLHQEAFEEKLGAFEPDLIIFTSDSSFNYLISDANLPCFAISVKKTTLSVSELREEIDSTIIAAIDEFSAPGEVCLRNFKSSHPLFALFTSGSTGKPKYILHGSAGYLIYSMLTAQYFLGVSEESRICVLSDAGWINGHSYAIYSPLALGATTILTELPATFCNPMKIVGLLRSTKIDILYIPVTMARILMSYWSRLSINDQNFVKGYGLFRIGTMGEMLSESVGDWLLDAFQPTVRNVMNSYFQTETGGIISANTASHNDTKHPTSCGTQMLDGFIKVCDLPNSKQLDEPMTELVATCSWPGIMIDAVRSGVSVIEDYFDDKGNFRFFDTGYYRDNKLFVGGRTDDVINIAGHRYSTHEIESLIVALPSISEVAAVGYRADIDSTESLAIFYTLSLIEAKQENIAFQIQDLIARRIDRCAIPSIIQQEQDLLKTKSGKLLRRFYRNVLERKPLGDLSSCLNPDVAATFLKRMNSYD